MCLFKEILFHPNSKDILLFYHLKTRGFFFSTQTLIDCYIWNEINIQFYFDSSKESTVLLSFTKYAFSLICSGTSVICCCCCCFSFISFYLAPYHCIDNGTSSYFIEEEVLSIKVHRFWEKSADLNPTTPSTS